MKTVQQKKTPIKTDKADVAGSMPDIRTMQDDLAKVRQKNSTKPEGSVAGSPNKSTGKSIQTPSSQPARSKPRRLKFVIVAVAVLAFISVGAGAAYWWVSQNMLSSGTIADYIPSNAELVLSASHDTPSLSSDVVSAANNALGVNDDSLSGNWSEIAYVLIPGGTSMDPIEFIVLAGDQKPSAIDGVTVMSLDDSVWGLVREERSGRVESLGRRLGSDRQIRTKAEDIVDADGMLYVSKEAAKRIHMSALDLNMPRISESMFFTLYDETTYVVAQSINDVNVSAILGNDLEDVLQFPTDVEFVTGNVVDDLDDWIQILNSDPNAEGFIRAIAEQPALGAYNTLLELFADSAIIGTRATDGSAKKETIIAIPLKQDSSDQAKTVMKTLEPALLELGPLLAGRAVETDGFLVNEYKNIEMRYANFPTMDRAVDYAVVDDVLLFTTSRGSMFDVIEYIQDGQGTESAIQEVIHTVVPNKEAWVWAADLQSSLFSGLSSSWRRIFGIFSSISVYSNDGGAESRELE